MITCAILDGDGVVQSVVVCCGGDPTKCSLKPVPITAKTGPAAPGYTAGTGGKFAPPQQPETVLATAAQVAGTASASVSVIK